MTEEENITEIISRNIVGDSYALNNGIAPVTVFFIIFGLFCGGCCLVICCCAFFFNSIPGSPNHNQTMGERIRTHFSSLNIPVRIRRRHDPSENPEDEEFPHQEEIPRRKKPSPKSSNRMYKNPKIKGSTLAEERRAISEEVDDDDDLKYIAPMGGGGGWMFGEHTERLHGKQKSHLGF